MKLQEFAETILFSNTIEDKLIPSSKETIRDITNFQAQKSFTIPEMPGRPRLLRFSDKNVKFPKLATLKHPDNTAKALHFFANHELLAIEMMACALIMFDSNTQEEVQFKKGLLQTIKDEQKHFKLYCERMKDFNLSFGDIPVNGYFWQKMQSIQTIAEFTSMMALTFESANLDFASFYRDYFTEIGDKKTAKVLDIVYKDEVTHVALGAITLDALKKDKSLWDYYRQVLPFPLTPARAKGMKFYRESRLESGLPESFVNNLENYRDEFKITDRREWKS